MVDSTYSGSQLVNEQVRTQRREIKAHEPRTVRQSLNLAPSITPWLKSSIAEEQNTMQRPIRPSIPTDRPQHPTVYHEKHHVSQQPSKSQLIAGIRRRSKRQPSLLPFRLLALHERAISLGNARFARGASTASSAS